MADRYLLEDGTGAYQLEDASGYYILEAQNASPGSYSGLQILFRPKDGQNTVFVVQDEIAVTTTTIVDEDGWIPWAKQSLQLVQPVLDTDEKFTATATIVSDDEWTRFVQNQWTNVVVQPAFTDELSFIYVDEVYWSVNGTIPVISPVVALSDNDEIGTPQVAFGLDDEGWSQRKYDRPPILIDMSGGTQGGPQIVVTPPVVADDTSVAWIVIPDQVLAARAVTTDDEVGTPTTLGVEDEYWQRFKQSLDLPSVQALSDTDEVGPQPINVEDEYWQRFRQTLDLPPVQAFTDTDEIGTPPTPIGVDEDYWNVNRFFAVQYPQALLDDEIGTNLVPIPPAPVDTGPPRQGGGPFYYKYGYDRAYDAIRKESTSSPQEPLDLPPLAVEAFAKPVDLRKIKKRLAKEISEEIRGQLELDLAKDLEEEEEEALLIMSMFL